MYIIYILYDKFIHTCDIYYIYDLYNICDIYCIYIIYNI